MLATACLRLPEFPAWVREESLPTGTPVAIHASERIVACSPPLRRRGLTTGESLDRARVLFPEARFFEQNRYLEEAHWEHVLVLLNEISPHLLPLHPGWALIGVVLRDQLLLVARSLRAALGIAPRRLAAMIASLQALPTDIVEVHAPEVVPFVDAAVVGHLVDLGVGPEIVERLDLLGLHRLGDVARLTRRHLSAQFGKEGKALYELLHPQKESPVPPFIPPPSVTVHREIDPPSVEPGDLEPVLELLIRDGIIGLGGLNTQRVTLRLDGPHPRSPRLARRILKEPTGRSQAIAAAATTLLRSLLHPDISTATMTLELGGLVQPAVVQGSLFDDRPDLQETVRRLNTRFPDTLYRITLMNSDALLAEESWRRVTVPP